MNRRKFDLSKAINELFKLSLSPKREKRLIKQVVGYVCQSTSEQRTAALITEAFAILNHFYWEANNIVQRVKVQAMLGMRHMAIPSAVAAVGKLRIVEQVNDAICICLYDTCRLGVFLRVYAEVHQYNADAYLKELHDLQGEFTNERQIRVAAQVVFTQRMLALAEGDLDRSMQFSLELLKEFSQIGQLASDCRVNVFSPTKGSAAFRLVFVAACTPPHESVSYLRGWFDTVLNNIVEDKSVNQVFESLYRMLVLNTENDVAHLVIIETEVEALTLLANQHKVPWMAFSPENLAAPYFLVTPAQTKKLEHWRDKVASLVKVEICAGNRFLEEIKSRKSEYDQAHARRCNEIRTQPKRGLRLGGADHVDITVLPLKNVGLRSIALYPEGNKFPDVNMVLMVRKETPHLLTFTATLRDFKLEVQETALHGISHDEDEVTSLLEMVVVDILYRLIVQERNMPRVGSKRIKSSDKKTGRTGSHQPPRLRRLPDGFTSTERAQELAAQATGWTLPPGWTFVKAHYRGGKIVHDYPNEPRLRYGNDLAEGLIGGG